MKIERVKKIENMDLEHKIKEEPSNQKKKADYPVDFKKILKEEIENPSYFGKNLYWPLFGFY